jgi:predicted ABC-type ATPase
MPNLCTIAGPNSGEKTTATMTILPDVLHINEFINADAIAAGIFPFYLESVAFQAGRIVLERIQLLINEGGNFAFETTLSTKSSVPNVKSSTIKRIHHNTFILMAI